MPEKPQKIANIKTGDTITVLQWRNSKHFDTKAAGPPEWQTDDEFWQIWYEDAEEVGYATWDENDDQWVDGEA